MNSDNIWSITSEYAESLMQQMSPATYGFFAVGLYVFGLALIGCQLASRGYSASPARNWFLLVTSFILGPRIPVLDPESAILKVMIFLSGVTVILLAPGRLSVFLSGNEKQRRRIQIALVAMLLVAFLVNNISGRYL